MVDEGMIFFNVKNQNMKSSYITYNFHSNPCLFRKQEKLLLLHLAIFICIVLFSCKKLVDVEAPTTSTNAANVYQNDETAAAVLTGIYTNMSNSTFSSGGLGTFLILVILRID